MANFRRGVIQLQTAAGTATRNDPWNEGVGPQCETHPIYRQCDTCFGDPTSGRPGDKIYPLTAPNVKPRIMLRCASATKMSAGIIIRADSAAIPRQSLVNV